MRILKALFKPLNLFFIVSISEDASKQFAVRAVGGQRNEFDSAFDRPIGVRRLPYKKTAEVLADRIDGELLPRPFVQLIWSISKGNARDTIRFANGLLEQSHEFRTFHELPTSGESALALQSATLTLVTVDYLLPLLDRHQDELARRRPVSHYRAILTEIATLHVAAYESVARPEDATAAQVEAEVGALVAACNVCVNELARVIARGALATDSSSGPVDESPLDTLRQLLFGIQYAALNLRTFAQSPTRERFQNVDGDGHLSRLEQAHRHVDEGSAYSVRLGLEMLSQFDKAVFGARPI